MKYISLHRKVSVALTAICMASLTPGLVQAQAQSTSSGISPSSSFVIKGFDISGENPLADGDVSRILAPFLRTDATIETLQKATAALEAAMKAKGYALLRVALPAQEVGESVKLDIVKFVIGKVSIEGLQQLSESNIRRSLPDLVEGHSPNFRNLAVQTTIANENPAKRVQVALKESEEPDQIDARIVVTEAKPWNFSLGLSNFGSDSTGNDRVTFAGGHSNLFDLDHQITLAYTASLERLNAVKQVGVNYRIPLYRFGGVLGLNYTQSDVFGDFGSFKSNGAGRTVGLNYNHYLPPDGGYRGYLSLSLDDKQFDVAQINGTPLVGQALRRSNPLTFGYSARVDGDNVVWGYNVDIALNASGGSGNDLNSYQSEDPRISTSRWRAVHAGANFATGFSNGWIGSLRGQIQYSPDALIAGEQFGLGGASSVRGTAERPISGDSGATLSVEVTTPEFMPGLRWLGFVDAGWLTTNSPNGNPKPSNDNLSSAGLGLRYMQSNFMLAVDFARVTTGSALPYTAGSGLPQRGDQKLHVNFSARF
jgi:hemolysin activation/secretion protein